jgi:hypothetical protein
VFRTAQLRIKNKENNDSAWIVLGLIAGFIGSKLVKKTGEGIVLDIVRESLVR